MVAVTFVLVEISPYIIFWNHCDIAEILKVVLNLAGWFLFKFLSASLLVTKNRNSDFWLAKLKNSPIWNLKPPSQLEPKLRGMVSDRSPQFPHFILIWQTTWLTGNSCFWMVKLRINMIPLGQWTKLLRNCVWKVFCTQKNYRRLIPLSIWFEVNILYQVMTFIGQHLFLVKLVYEETFADLWLYHDVPVVLYSQCTN